MKRTVPFGCLILSLVLAGALSAQEFGARFRPFVGIPLGTPTELFTVGGGLDAVFDVDLSSFKKLSNPLDIGYSIGPLFTYMISPGKSTGTVMHTIGGAVDASVFYYWERVNARISGGAGLYGAFYEGEKSANIWWNVAAEAGFRFSPTLILSGVAGYRSYSYPEGGPLWSGLFAGVSLQVKFEVGGNKGELNTLFAQEEPVFPVFLGLYRNNPPGTITLTNLETAEIRNVKVTFAAGNYTAASFDCGAISRLGKRKSAEIPLYADFSSDILNFSEQGRIPGELTVTYELLGAKRKATAAVTVQVYNRNSFRWNDPASLAVFVSPTAPEVLDYSKYIIGLARNRLRTGLNNNFQNALYLFEGMRAAGITDSLDKQTPYVSYHKDASLLDFIQFPFQTLAYHTGDIDDLGLLYAAALEASGIKCAVIPLDDDFVVAFSMGIDERAAMSFFESADSFMTVGGEAWVPVSFGYFREGFVNCWNRALNGINAALASGGEINFVILQDSWANYPPAPLKPQDIQFEKPGESRVVAYAETSMARYLSMEFGPKIDAALAELRRSGPSVTLYNRLGLLYVRSGMMDEAKQMYTQAAGMGSAAAMANLGNMAYLERDFAAAENWYKRALALEPANRAAQTGLVRIAEAGD